MFKMSQHIHAISFSAKSKGEDVGFATFSRLGLWVYVAYVSNARSSFVTYGDRLATEDPYFYCEHCYKPIHYDSDGKLLYADFEVFPYYQSVQIHCARSEQLFLQRVNMGMRRELLHNTVQSHLRQPIGDGSLLTPGLPHPFGTCRVLLQCAACSLLLWLPLQLLRSTFQRNSMVWLDEQRFNVLTGSFFLFEHRRLGEEVGEIEPEGQRNGCLGMGCG